MKRNQRKEDQASIAKWSQDNDNRTPDETLQGFLDAAKELDVVWYTGEYFDLPDKLGDAMVELILSAVSIDMNMQDALDAAMVRRRKGGQ